MEMVPIVPRGYCYGVVDALVLVQRVAQDPTVPRPIYVLGMIVHNRHVVESLASLGVQTLDGPNRSELLDSIGVGTVIFTAHGVAPDVRHRAIAKGLHVVDATCPDVTRTHDLIREKVANGYTVLYIGRGGHPEPEGAMGVVPPERVYLVEREEDVEGLVLPEGPILVTNQTTMSQWDTQKLVDSILERYPEAEVHNEICLATQQRQEAVAQQAVGLDLVLVVGDERSNNANRLVQVARECAGVDAYRVADLHEIDIKWLLPCQRVGVTAGASTPTSLTREVMAFVSQFSAQDPTTWEAKIAEGDRRLLPRIRPLTS
ncbi:4-hydroxy-3-methylbut-2-enyl diphosphate reductase [Pasteuria penetrans]|uniref:4-hydroxy-3-methylbut-2-enyl diphosphate reductase n=1 Tax=Pasteuria penetrans TaxID=86005 RepID=UPI000FAA1580|nr:4-hydroxy-3-methylbut-2-enyl diphosphate reductase [Pasteuria penetrans]